MESLDDGEVESVGQGEPARRAIGSNGCVGACLSNASIRREPVAALLRAVVHYACKPAMRFVSKWLLRLVLLLAIIALAIVVGAAVNARSRIPDLKPWHHLVPSAEVRASDVGPTFTLDAYLAREQKVFDEVRTRIENQLPSEERLYANRYDREGLASPSRLRRDWNRTFEIAAAPPMCAALLVHGLTDSPY